MCLGNTTPDPKAFCPTWIERLDRIHDAMPSFASWRIDELRDLFSEYRGILDQVGSHQVLLYKCKPLLNNLPVIEGSIQKACRDRNWLPFNRASLEMGWDIEILREVLNVYAKK